MIQSATLGDSASIDRITMNAGVFTPEEGDCVRELWQAYLQHGSEASGYYFVVEKHNMEILGYACYGPHSLTKGTYNLYWIAVDPNFRRVGVGKHLINWVENAISQLGGRLIIIETSSLDKYIPTHRFYLASGYNQDGVVKDFYDDGDDLVIYSKHISRRKYYGKPYYRNANAPAIGAKI